MYVSRLASGSYGVFRADGRRIAVKRTKREADRYLKKLLKEGRT